MVRAEATLQSAVEELGPGVMADLAADQSITAADLRSATFEIGVVEQHADTPHPAVPAVPARPPPLPDPEPVLEDFPAPAPARGAEVPGAGAAISAVGLHAALAEAPSESAAATPTSGYVDLFGDAARGDDGESAAGQPSTDPFLAAGPGAPQGDRGAPPASVQLFRAPEREQGAVIAIPPRRKRTGPFVLIGAGALFLVGILAFVLLGGQPPGPPPPPPPPRVAVAPLQPAAPPIPVIPAPAPDLAPEPAPAPAPAAQPAPAPAAAVRPAVAEPEAAEPRRAEKRPATAAGAREDRRAREREAAAAARDARARQEREAAERDAAAKEARAREEREAQERERIAREARAREAREAQERERAERAQQEQQQVAAASLGEASEALTQDQVQKVLSSSRKAFDTCIASAGKSSGVALDGRRVMLRLNIQPTGSVTYPTLDDVTLNGTDLGSCLKSAARVMVFPRFKGDPMHVELPLVLAPAR
jgi:hypothetical protein